MVPYRTFVLQKPFSTPPEQRQFPLGKGFFFGAAMDVCMPVMLSKSKNGADGLSPIQSLLQTVQHRTLPVDNLK